MEQRKPRNKKGIGKPVKEKDEKPKISAIVKNSSNETVQRGMTSGIKKLNPEDYDYVNSDKTQFAHLKRETETSDVEEKRNVSLNPHSRRQISSNWGKYEEIPDSETPGKNFQDLLNLPISQGGHFIFKSEKKWSIEVTKYSDLFSLNVKKLARDIDCIPFTEYIDVEDKYFTVDQLTRFHNLAEKSRSNIEVEKIVETKKDSEKKKKFSSNNEETVNEIQTRVSNEIPETIQDQKIEEELDFLLSLKEPVQIDQPRISQTKVYPTHTSEDEKNQSSSSVPVKSIDLEKWLDSILDS